MVKFRSIYLQKVTFYAFYLELESFSIHYYQGERSTRTSNLSHWLLIVLHITFHPHHKISQLHPRKILSEMSLPPPSSTTAISSSIPLYILHPPLLVHIPIFVGSPTVAVLLCGLCLCPHEVYLALHCHCRAFHSHRPTDNDYATVEVSLCPTIQQRRWIETTSRAHLRYFVQIGRDGMWSDGAAVPEKNCCSSHENPFSMTMVRLGLDSHLPCDLIHRHFLIIS